MAEEDLDFELSDEEEYAEDDGAGGPLLPG